VKKVHYKQLFVGFALKVIFFESHPNVDDTDFRILLHNIEYQLFINYNKK